MLLNAQSWLMLTSRCQAPGGVRQVASGGQCFAGAVWCVVWGRWRAVYGGWNHDLTQCHSLNHLFSVATETRSHDASWPWCWQLLHSTPQERSIIGTWGVQISDSDFQAGSVAHFPSTVGVCVWIVSGADSDNGDADGYDNVSNGDGDYSTGTT